MKYIVRIYDEELDRQIQEVFKTKKNQYPSMNALLTELIETGLKSPVSHLKNVETEKLLHEAIDTLIQGFEKQIKDNEIITKLLSSIYALVLAKNEEGYLSRSMVEKGFYDELPSRFEDNKNDS